MKSIMPFTRDYEEVFVHTLVRYEEAQYELDFRDPSFQVVSLTFEVLTVINPINVMMGKVHTHLFVKGIYLIS